jgi:AraC family transcriptional regulator, dual regulator of chb operon
MPAPSVHFKLQDFVRPGEAYHYARTTLTADNVARYHDHDYHEVFWVLRGEGEHRWNGRKSPLRAGTLCLIRPADRHVVTGSAHSPLLIVNLAFPNDAWQHVQRRYFSDERDCFALPEAQRMWKIELRGASGPVHWAERLNHPVRPRVVLDGFLMELPFWRPHVASSTKDAVPDWLMRAQREIVRPENFGGGTLAFARLAGRSPSHVARAAVRTLGRTPTEIVNAARIEHSAQQLAETTKPILDIMLDCGLTNLSHFYALFRKRFGVSPRRYRLQAHPTVRG